jgi:hypothetical protein
MRKTNSYFIWEVVILAVMFIVGMVAVAPNTEVAGKTLTGIWGNYLPELAFKLTFVVVFSIIQSWLFFRFVLQVHSLGELKEKFRASHNDSHAWLLLGIAGSAVAIFTMSGGFNAHQYLYCFLTKGPIGYVIAFGLTAIISRIFGVKSMADFKSWVETEDNDSYSILVVGILILSMVLAMSV